MYIVATTGSGFAQIEARPPQRITDATVYLKAPVGGEGSGFGQSIAMGPNHLAVTIAYWDDGIESGPAVVVYGRNGDQLRHVRTEVFANSQIPSIAIDGHRLIVGDPSQGEVTLFDLGTDSVTEAASINAASIGASGEFGTDVDISGEVAVIGDPGYTTAESAATGAVIVLHESNGWTSPDVIVADEVSAASRFGLRVAASANQVASSDGQEGVSVFDIGDPGAAVRLTSEHDEFGFAVDLDEGVLVVGAPGADSTEWLGTIHNHGAATVFELIEGSWQEVGGTGGSYSQERSGTSVAVVGDKVIVGTPWDPSSSTGVVAQLAPPSTVRSGRIDFLTKVGGQWQILRFAKPQTLVEGMGFGSAIALAEDAAVVHSVGQGYGTGINPAPGTDATSSGAVHLLPIREADPTRGVLVSEPPSGTHAEGGPDTYIEFRLATKPAAPVDVVLELSDARFQVIGPLDAQYVRFDQSNWSVPQRITLRPQNNEALDGDTTTTITVSQWSIDGDYYRQTSDPDNGFGRFISGGLDRNDDPRTIDLHVTDDDVPYETVIIGTRGAGMLPSGDRYGGEDLLRWDPVTLKWTIEFDGSDVGLAGAEIGPIDRIGPLHWYFSFTRPVTIPARFSVTGKPIRVGPYDIVAFEATMTGPDTAGLFSPYFFGRDYGLGAAGTEIDGFEADPTVPHLSITGTMRVRDTDGRRMTIGPSDIVQPWHGVRGFWFRWFRGSELGLTQPRENILDFTLDWFGIPYRFVTDGGFNVPTTEGPLTGDRHTVLECLGFWPGVSGCTYRLGVQIQGPAPAGRIIDGLDFEPAATP